MGEKFHEPHCVASADICDFEVLSLSRDGRVQHVFEAVEPKPVLEDEAGGVLVATTEHVVIVLSGCHI